MLTTVDTSAMSIAMRRRSAGTAREQLVQDEVSRLASAGDLLLPGAVRQELLTGFRDPGRYREVRGLMRAFPDVPPGIADYERAAEMANACRRSGIQGSPTDFLVCSMAEATRSVILTLDGDFAKFAQYIPIRLHPLSRT